MPDPDVADLARCQAGHTGAVCRGAAHGLDSSFRALSERCREFGAGAPNGARVWLISDYPGSTAALGCWARLRRMSDEIGAAIEESALP